MKKSLAILSVSIALVACVPPTNESIGTVSGGVIGGLIGSQFGAGSGQIAAAIGGTMLGAYVGGNIGRTMDRLDRLELQRALETAPTGRTRTWQNPDTGNQYSVKPTRTYQKSNQPCREYVTTATIAGKQEKVYGKACRQADGSWKVAN